MHIHWRRLDEIAVSSDSLLELLITARTKYNPSHPTALHDPDVQDDEP
jgi:hypothetical protein